jgi:hypothetical protein
MTTPAPVTDAPDAGPSDTAPQTRGFSDLTLVVITAAVTLPVLWMGYGTDIDVTDVIKTATGIRHGSYQPSRTPGVPVFEGIAAVLDPIGGHLLLNLATAAAGAAAVVGIARLVRHWGHANADLLALAFLASPATLIAATSTGDFVWAVAFLVWALLALVADRPVVAGVLGALAVGTRLSSVFLVLAFLVADGWDRERRPRALRAGLVALPLGALLYVPSWLAFDRSWAFLHTAEGWRGLANNLGRFSYKGYVTFGGLFLVLMLVAVPALVAALRHWDRDPMLRTGVLGLAVSLGLFFVLPWKYNHLLPCLVTALLWLGASRRNTRGYLWLVIGALAINGLVTFRPLAPDTPAEAEGGRWDPALTAGLLVNDIDCRLDAMHEPLRPLNGDAWDCTLKPMRGAVTEDPTGDPTRP